MRVRDASDEPLECSGCYEWVTRRKKTNTWFLNDALAHKKRRGWTATDIECDMSIFPYSSQEQFDPAYGLDARLIFVAFADQVLRIAV